MVSFKVKATPTRSTEVAVAQAKAPELNHVNWRTDPGLRKLSFFAGVICVASATTDYDGLPIVPFIADRFGGKFAIITSCVIMLIATAVQGASQNLAMFKGGRSLMGFVNSMVQLSSPLLLTEFCYPQHRGRITASLWNLGAIVNTWLSFGTKRIPSEWSWRIPTIIQGAPSLIQLIFIFWCPESPRWLISKDRTDEALAILSKYHANGDSAYPTVQFEYAEIKEAIRLESIYKKSSSYLDFLKTQGNRHRLLLVGSLGPFSQWSGNGLVAYCATDIYKPIGITSSHSSWGSMGVKISSH
ncbi:uncharacterized protein A1O9_05056 [Exophiala aquamarina CBS 119918]|uniref:Major facilitator superfamily (MFS) profile domain-containing protein n=1 Tax=Exophiala aquamarina CBS 119918 TaxID=1182545 RepID=A0A072PK00_9EURO|nr:uncharacterized protein A1O9_05056 [Exophiala aquamarina CBS 119918]KEF60206.1 hypothetical protein A1O9_05056 [Exophiala aquamarina CBS 119918]